MRLLLMLFIFSSKIIFSQDQLQVALTNFIKDPVNKNAKITFKVIDLENGQTIASHRPEYAIVGASTTKLFSSATAIEILGGDFQMKTRIYFDGHIDKDSVLHGNLWIRGGGDVSLGSKYFSKENHEMDFLLDWTDSLKRYGIKHIEGALIADASEFGYAGAPATWSQEDVGNYYGAFAAGINFYDNTMKIFFKTGASGTKAQYIERFPSTEGFQLKNNLLAANVSADQSNVYGKAFELNRTISGTIPCNRSYFAAKGSMPDPEIELAQEWLAVLLKNNIQVSDGAKSVRLHFKNHTAQNYRDKTMLFEVKSKTIQEITYWTNLKSVNLFAEGLLNATGYYQNGNGSTSSGVKEVMNYWSSRIDTKGLIINDGSGLSRSNAISANHFCALLSYMYRSPKFKDFESTLPIAGETGTVKSVCSNGAADGRIHMKSGTLRGVKAFSGYVYTSTGKKLAFSLSVNNFSCSSEGIVHKMEPLLNEMAKY